MRIHVCGTDMALASQTSDAETHLGVPVAVVRNRTRDADAEYTALFRSEFPAVVRTVYVILHDREIAEDVAQQAFTQMLIHWRKVSQYDRPEAWVRRVAIRLASRTARRERVRWSLHHGDEPPHQESPIDIDLMHAVQMLPPQQRAAVALFYLEDRPVQEVASLLDCSESTAKGHLFKARRRLALLLHEDGGEAHDDD